MNTEAQAPPREHHLAVSRTARWYAVGEPGPHVRRVWIALHGYGQLAGRFAQQCAVLAGDDALVAVPEALSRFYVGADVRAHAQTRVGASWMTREDRLADIADYVAYLDALHARLIEEQDAAPPLLRVLGFSQGVATACRWAALGEAAVERLVLWSGSLPHDLDLAACRSRLSAVRFTIVYGVADDLYDAGKAAADVARLREHGLSAELRVHDGAHHLDERVLHALVDS